jgi:hypothetical protein
VTLHKSVGKTTSSIFFVLFLNILRFAVLKCWALGCHISQAYKTPEVPSAIKPRPTRRPESLIPSTPPSRITVAVAILESSPHYISQGLGDPVRRCQQPQPAGSISASAWPGGRVGRQQTEPCKPHARTPQAG